MFEDAAYEEDVFGTVRAVVRPRGRQPLAPGPAVVPPPAPISAPISAPVAALVEALDLVLAQSPAELPGPQALADTAALLNAVERLHAGVLPRLADVEARRLHGLDGAPSTAAWVAQQRTSLDRSEVALARRMRDLPRLAAAVQSGSVSVVDAERVGKALARVRRLVDRPDGLIDGLDGEAVVRAVVVDGVQDLICTAVGGLDAADPRVVDLQDRLAAIATAPATQYARLEASFVLLAERLEPVLLPSALRRLVDALLPGQLEDRLADAQAQRGLSVHLNSDGSGWHVSEGELDLETGELLHAVLTAEMAVDGDNAADTEAYTRARSDGWESADGPDALPARGPRSLRQRRHDALRSALRRLLDSGDLGLRDRVAPHLSAVVPFSAMQDAPGALPAVTPSGAHLPASVLRAWTCQAAITRFVVGLGRRVLETSHTERTLKAHERRVKQLETGGRCQGAGCSCPPGTPLVPHHVTAWARSATTSLADTVLLCLRTHHDVHVGKQRIRLRDGRWLDEDGWQDGPRRGAAAP